MKTYLCYEFIKFIYNNYFFTVHKYFIVLLSHIINQNTMKKNLILSLSTAVLLSVALFSCKKDNGIAANKNTTDLTNAEVANVNGRLVFKDSKALNQTINELINKDPETLSKWEKSLGVKSLRSDSAAVAAFASFGFPDFYESI